MPQTRNESLSGGNVTGSMPATGVVLYLNGAHATSPCPVQVASEEGIALSHIVS